MILSGGLPVFPFLPAVAIFPVLHLLTVVEDHRAILRPDGGQTARHYVNAQNKCCAQW